MEFKRTTTTANESILANDHFVAISYDCSAVDDKDTGIIPAGTIVPANDGTAIGVLLSDVILAENPNGAVIIHGFIDKSKLPEEPAASTAVPALKQITFI